MALSPQVRSVDYVAHQRLLDQIQKKRPAHIVTSVGRLTEQKMALLLKLNENKVTALETLLQQLENRGLLLLLGSGDTELEKQCELIAARYPQLIFMNQYSVALSDLLFTNGNLFLMPSSFEPCGISQMLAMKEGQPCLAHAVGGLADTIVDDADGFLFKASSFNAQMLALTDRFQQVLSLREKQPDQYLHIATTARGKRFEWRTSAARYHSELYA